MEDLSPPFQSPEVLNRQQLVQNSSIIRDDSKVDFRLILKKWTNRISLDRHRHCNKFYPFTNHQLRHFDHDTYVQMAEMWDIVKRWKDPFAVKPCWNTFMTSCFNTRRAYESEHDLSERLLSSTGNAVVGASIGQLPESINELVPDSVEL